MSAHSNDLLYLKGKFEQDPRGKAGFPSPSLKEGTQVTSAELEKLASDLILIQRAWREIDYHLSGVLVSIFYNRLIPKSSRVQATFSSTPNKSVVGARFTPDLQRHIITHLISHDQLTRTIADYRASAQILHHYFSGRITHHTLKKEQLTSRQIDFKSYEMSKTKFQKIIVDASNIASFGNYHNDALDSRESIVTLFSTEQTSSIQNTMVLMQRMGITLTRGRFIDSTTMLLTRDEYSVLADHNPYLISMAVSNLNDLALSDIAVDPFATISIPEPSNEPTIGVIDTLFDTNVYFSQWVDYHCLVDENIPTDAHDMLHGTAVSSLIVDGASINPDLDDGCGRFRVRHFGVATSRQFSSFTILQHIREIVAANRDIKVWNLSLGSTLPISSHSISPEGALLDNLQSRYDVIFVVAGTNKGKDSTDRLIGAPADSLNSVVVNSCSRDKKSPASYSRRGPALSFFIKPDLCYFGGDFDDRLSVCTGAGESKQLGSSFAAPWIARKLSYMIDKLGLDRNIAKALLIHSAIPWEDVPLDSDYLGRGSVPTSIRDILEAPSDEIRFVISDTSEEYNTYNYKLPVPLVKEQHPYIVKATMCYFPACMRNQGVDYTNTEFDFSFGRIGNNGKLKVTKEKRFSSENALREQFRKWDNVKIIQDVKKSNNRAKKSYDADGRWGIQIKTEERHPTGYGKGMRFGIVISLKAIDEKNRIEEFIHNCEWRGWLVNRIRIEEQIEIHQLAEQEIEFE